MAKNKKQPPSETISETPEQQQARLKRAVEGVQGALRDNRAVINVTRLNLVEGRLIPEVQVQILK